MSDDSTWELAAALGLEPETLLRELGEFRQVTDVEDCDPIFDRTWWVSGHPAQVLLGVDTKRRVWVAQPRLAYRGPIPLLSVHGAVPLQAGADGPAQVDDVAVRTRRRFRYCRQCRTAHPPEYFNSDPRVCDGCSQTRGVVF